MEVYLKQLNLEGDIPQYVSLLRVAGFSKPSEFIAANPSMQDLLTWGIDSFEDIKRMYFALHPEDAAIFSGNSTEINEDPPVGSFMEATYGFGGEFDEELELPEDPEEAYLLMKEELERLRNRSGGSTVSSEIDSLEGGSEVEELLRLKEEYAALVSGKNSQINSAGNSSLLLEENELDDEEAELEKLKLLILERQKQPEVQSDYEATKATLEKLKLKLLSGDQSADDDEIDNVLDQVFSKYGKDNPSASNSNSKNVVASPRVQQNTTPIVVGSRSRATPTSSSWGQTPSPRVQQGSGPIAGDVLGSSRGRSNQAPLASTRNRNYPANPPPTNGTQTSMSSSQNPPLRTSSPATTRPPQTTPTTSGRTHSLNSPTTTSPTNTSPRTLNSPTQTRVGSHPTNQTAPPGKSLENSTLRNSSTPPARPTTSAPRVAPKMGINGVQLVEMDAKTKMQLEALRAMAKSGTQHTNFGNDLKIIVSDPVQVGKGQVERTMYLVTLTTNMKQFSHLTYNTLQVRRSYHHFEELYKKLQSCCNYNLPKFPKKDVMNRFSKQTISDRMTFFQMLLDHIARDSGLNQLSCVVEFFDNSKFADLRKFKQ